MAETIVNFVLGKLVDVAVKEVLLMYGLDEQVEKVRRHLERCQAFLKDADRKRITDERQKQWVKEVRDVAYLIEDVIDTFLLEVWNFLINWILCIYWLDYQIYYKFTIAFIPI